MLRTDKRDDPAPAMAPASESSKPESRRGVRRHRVEAGLMLLGCAALGFCGLVSAEAGLYQAFQNGRLEWLRQTGIERHEHGAAKFAPSGLNSLVGRIEIPSLGLSAVIREGSDTHTLLIAVGHVPGTALPGEDGNVVVSGHRDSFFRDLREIRVGDEVNIVTLQEVFQYRVDSTSVVEPGQTEVLGPTEAPTLTLITCYPFDFIGPAPKRFIVKARQV